MIRFAAIVVVLLQQGVHLGFDKRTNRLEGSGKGSRRTCGSCGGTLPASGVCSRCSSDKKKRGGKPRT